MSKIPAILARLKPQPEPFLVDQHVARRLGLDSAGSNLHLANVKHSASEVDGSSLMSGASTSAPWSRGQTEEVTRADCLKLPSGLCSPVNRSSWVGFHENSSHDLIDVGSHERDSQARSSLLPLTTSTSRTATETQALGPETPDGEPQAPSQVLDVIAMTSSPSSHSYTLTARDAAAQSLDTEGSMSPGQATELQSSDEAGQVRRSSLADPLNKKRKAAKERPPPDPHISTPIFSPEYTAVEATMNSKGRSNRQVKEESLRYFNRPKNAALKVSSAMLGLPPPLSTESDAYDSAPFEGEKQSNIMPNHRPG